MGQEVIDLARIEGYIASANPTLPYAIVAGLASDAAALMVAEAAVYTEHNGATRIDFLAGYTGLVTQASGTWNWVVLGSDDNELASGETGDSEEAFMSVESMVEALVSEGV